MTDFAFDIDYYQVCKNGKHVCGDSFMTSRSADGRIIAILSDGLGSGVKANILSTMTAKMALKFVDANWDVKKYCEVISSVLPICKERGLNYSTFTILDLSPDGQVQIFEQGNPSFLFVRGGRIIEPEARKSVEEYHGLSITTTSLSLLREDRIVFFSDGISQAGTGTPDYPNGWGREGAAALALKVINRNPQVSSLKICETIIREARIKDGPINPKDDITCAAVYLRTPRRVMIFSGPPFNKSLDGKYAKQLAAFEGQKVICGGTTAKIVARELGLEVRPDLNSSSRFGPPTSLLDGIDLVTEGVLTLSQTLAALQNHKAPQSESGAYKLYYTLLENDYIDIVAGTRINDAYQDPDFPNQFVLRRSVLEGIARALREKYFKDVRVKLV